MRVMNLLRGLNFWVVFIATSSLAIGLITLYLALNDPEPNVTIEVVNDTNVLDLRTPLQDLNIIFRGTNIQEQNLNLRIASIRIANSGDLDILPVHYDPEDDWGLEFSNAEVIEARLTDSNSVYLEQKIMPHRLGANVITFPKVIFEVGKFFTIEVLLLHPKDGSLSISAMGKIAGVSEIKVLNQPWTGEVVVVGDSLQVLGWEFSSETISLTFTFAAVLMSSFAVTFGTSFVRMLTQYWRMRSRRKS